MANPASRNPAVFLSTPRTMNLRENDKYHKIDSKFAVNWCATITSQEFEVAFVALANIPQHILNNRLNVPRCILDLLKSLSNNPNVLAITARTFLGSDVARFISFLSWTSSAPMPLWR